MDTSNLWLLVSLGVARSEIKHYNYSVVIATVSSGVILTFQRFFRSSVLTSNNDSMPKESVTNSKQFNLEKVCNLQ